MKIIIATCREMLEERDTNELNAEVARLENEANCIVERLRKLVEENARVRIEQAEYQQEYDARSTEYERISEKIGSTEARIQERAKHRRWIEVFQRMLAEQEACAVFAPYTFATLIDKVVIRRDRTLQFCFRNGMRNENRLIKKPAIREQSSVPLKNCRNLRTGVE